ncbi:MAG: GNAT family N-acetyltransferase [Halohasta sp.]
MAIDITTVHDPTAWNDLVEQSPQATPFHLAESLDVMARHAEATLHPYVGYKGNEPVGVFPVFELSKGPVSTAFSPPPRLKISYLGPALLNHTKRKQRRAEKTNSRFISACLAELDETVDPKYIHLRTSVGYTDTRPLIWAGFEPTTRYTYVVDLAPDPEDLLAAFSSDARSNITGTDEAAYEIDRGGVAEIRRTIRRLQERHAEQDVPYDLTPEFVVDLWRRLPDDAMEIHCCRVDGELVGGHIVLEAGESVYGWQSWGDMDAPVPVNDLLDWSIITAARDRGCKTYDLVGANNERISTYKAKFNPELRTYQTMSRGTPVMNLASEIYKRVR